MERSRYTCEGLPTGDILISDIREEISEATVCRYFGPKSSKSGWKYSSLTTVEEQSAILSLYRKVYETEDPPNKEITLSFAKGLILMSQGRSVNWAQFAAERRKVREALKKKSEDRKVKREREREGADRNEGSGALSFPSVLGKKRCTVGREDIGFPGSFSLSVKSEFNVEGSGMGRKSSSKSGRSFGGPRWGRDEIESMVRAIDYHEALAQECKTTLVESRRELEAIEDKLRREKLLLSDRQLMLDEVKLRLSRLSEEELPLQCAVEEKSRTLANLELNGGGSTSSSEIFALRKDIAALTSERDGLSFRKASDELIVRLCGEAIVGCSGQVKDLQCALRTSSESTAKTESRVSSLESALLSMREQLIRMQVGDGTALYPRPLESSPQVPVVETHTLNACLVCSLWFECFNYSSLDCGHTYHPYCLAEYAQKSSKFLISSCREPFASKSLVAIGNRPTTRPTVEAKVLRSVTEDVTSAKSNHDTTGTGATTRATSSPTSYWGKESPEKITPLSQSSQTDVTSKQCSSEPTEKTSSLVVCELCGVKEASVFIKACGHDVFCFGCIQGLQECPVCGGAITGWGRNNLRSKPSPTLILTKTDSEHGDHGAVRANTVQLEEKSDCPTEDAEKADSFADDSSDGSDSDNGLVQWCGSEEFNNGGARSHQDLLQSEVPMQEGKSELPSLQAMMGSRGAKRFAAMSNLLDTVKPGPESEESLHSCKRGRSQHPTQSQRRKFKKIEEMAADDGRMQIANIEPRPELRKRSVGRPSSASKLNGQKLLRGTQASIQGPLKSTLVPIQQLRSTLRRREVHDSVPVKFRGM